MYLFLAFLISKAVNYRFLNYIFANLYIYFTKSVGDASFILLVNSKNAKRRIDHRNLRRYR